VPVQGNFHVALRNEGKITPVQLAKGAHCCLAPLILPCTPSAGFRLGSQKSTWTPCCCAHGHQLLHDSFSFFACRVHLRGSVVSRPPGARRRRGCAPADASRCDCAENDT